eukprot:CAMPEP_0196579554 /NCGR_PEP_ID=MMETSP1081-20130531/22729_1 /TAXON_ID=36882 /ORGANISM="Pyramimonas amylifera, Strain CCMP720" /LENGTH=452 /DNA_ID=CAMNT_0041899179 /DNA_START=134 /DNA_END=1492 /DNA_ORIENTATION=+
MTRGNHKMQDRAKFMLVCPPKAISFDESHCVVGRTNTDMQVLALFKEHGMDSHQIQLVPGGGLAVESASKHVEAAQISTLNSNVVVFEGRLNNFEYLASKIGLTPDTVEYASLKKDPNAEAILISIMYENFSVKTILGKLRGIFSFLVLNTETVRVFAAIDPSGTIPMKQCHMSDGTHIVANFDFCPAEERDEVHEIPAGCFIAGGRRAMTPEMFSPPLAELTAATEVAKKAVASALLNISAVSPIATKMQKRRRRPNKNKQAATKAEDMAIPALNINATAFMPSRPKSEANSKEGLTTLKLETSETTKNRASQSSWWRKNEDSTDSAPSPLRLVSYRREEKDEAEEKEEKDISEEMAKPKELQGLIEEAVGELHRIASTKSITEWSQQAEEEVEHPSVRKLAAEGKPMSRTSSFRELHGGMVKVPSCRDVFNISSDLGMVRATSYSELSAL